MRDPLVRVDEEYVVGTVAPAVRIKERVTEERASDSEEDGDGVGNPDRDGCPA